MPSICPEHAYEILGRYGLSDSHVEFLSDVDCTVFRVRTAGTNAALLGGDAVLKVFSEDKQDAKAIQSEVDWLLALHERTNLRVPRPLASMDGSIVQRMSFGAQVPRYTILYTWLEGRPFDEELTPAALGRVGKLVGNLHRHSERWHSESKSGSTRHTFSREVPGWILGMRERPENLSPDQWRVLVATATKLQTDISAIGETPGVYGFVHGDLYPKNFLFHEDTVGVIDFSDCGWGHYADDLASVLVFLNHPIVGNFDHSAEYDELRAACLEGYSEVRALPTDLEDSLATYFAAKIFLTMTYTHQAIDRLPWVRECVSRSFEFFERYVAGE